jgi:hypothetical protein
MAYTKYPVPRRISSARLTWIENAIAAGAAGGGTEGPAGPPGPPGPEGPPGAVGPAGLNWRGAYDPAVTYAKNDAVGYGGASWFSLTASNAGNTPDSSPASWALLASQGARGPAGADGAPGAQGVKGDPGVKGDKGDPGVKGDPGPAGPGVAAGGTTGQLLAKVSGADYATVWTDPPSGGSGGGGEGPIYSGAGGTAIDATGYSAAVITPASMAQPTDLPPAAAPAVTGKRLTVRNASGQNSMVLRAQGGETLDGLPQRYIMPLGSLTVQSDGANWVALSSPRPAGTVLASFSRTSMTTSLFSNPIDFDNAVYEPIPGVRVATPTPRLILPEAGWYRFHGHISSPSTVSGGLVKVIIQKNGIDVRVYGMTAPPSGAFAAMAYDETVFCTPADYVQFFLGTTGSVRSDHSAVMISAA